MKKPDKHQVSLAAAALSALMLFITVGSAVTVYKKLIPYVTALELENARLELHRRLDDNYEEDAEEKEHRCKNTVARIQTDLFRAQQNEFEASKVENHVFAASSRRAQIAYREDIAGAKRECGF